MEAQLLRDMIADRDNAIEKLKRRSQEQLDKESELLSSLDELRSQAEQQSQQIREEKVDLIKAQRVAHERLHLVQADFGRQCSSLHAYCKDTEKDAQEDPAYVMRMQAQLCKAMHSMGISDHQLEMAEKHAETILKYQKETLSHCTEEKTQSELKHMNDLIAIDIQQREVKAGFEERLGEIFAEREVLNKQIEENEDSEEEEEEEEGSDDEEEELDEEEKQAKQEMMKVLTEKKQEIARLEKEQEENEDTITELEEQLEELDIQEQVAVENGGRVLENDDAAADDESVTEEDESTPADDEGTAEEDESTPVAGGGIVEEDESTPVADDDCQSEEDLKPPDETSDISEGDDSPPDESAERS